MLTSDIRFTKMQAYGNDYVYIDAVNQDIIDPRSLARQMSNRHFGIGSDGLVMICPSEIADFRMRIFNPDGSEAEMCGNAVRSVGKYVFCYGLTAKREIKVETIGGIKTLHLDVRGKEVKNITAEIGLPILAAEKVPVITKNPVFTGEPIKLDDRIFTATAMSLGNPHCVSFVDDVFGFDVKKYGPLMECNDIFPEKTNVEFCEIFTRQRLRLRTWERNTGETMACGTGCCVCVVAGCLAGLCDNAAEVEQIGGITHIEWENGNGRLFMTAPSEIVFDGIWRAQFIDTEKTAATDRVQGFAGRP